MKYIYIRFVVLSFLTVGLFSSCSKLEEQPYTFVSPNVFYKDATEVNIALLGVYSKYRANFGTDPNEWPDGYLRLLELFSEFGAPNHASYSSTNTNSWMNINDPGGPGINRYARAYQVINAANVIVGRSVDVEMDETLKQQYQAEARFLRGLCYFNLVRLYGGVPIPAGFTEGMDGLQLARATVDETYDYIIADLLFASENLPAKTDYGAGDVWRASSGAAIAMLGKVYLFKGSLQGNADDFRKSSEYSYRVMQSGVYDLEEDFKDLWYWYNTNNKNGKESIFELQFSHDVFGQNILHGYTTNFGLGANAVTGAYSYATMTSPTITAYLAYDDQDLRKSGTFVTSLTLANGTDTKWNAEDKGIRPGTSGWTSSYPAMIKFGDRTESSVVYELPAADIYVMRYAEVLLNFAEAENEVNGGPTAEAYAAINKVRERAGLTGLNGLSKEDFAAAVYQERGFEFIGEGQMFYEGVRTGRIGDGVENEIGYGMENGWFMYTIPLAYKPTKNFLFKIPLGDMNANPLLEQNPDNN